MAIMTTRATFDKLWLVPPAAWRAQQRLVPLLWLQAFFGSYFSVFPCTFSSPKRELFYRGSGQPPRQFDWCLCFTAEEYLPGETNEIDLSNVDCPGLVSVSTPLGDLNTAISRLTNAILCSEGCKLDPCWRAPVFFLLYVCWHDRDNEVQPMAASALDYRCTASGLFYGQGAGFLAMTVDFPKKSLQTTLNVPASGTGTSMCAVYTRQPSTIEASLPRAPSSEIL